MLSFHPRLHRTRYIFITSSDSEQYERPNFLAMGGTVCSREGSIKLWKLKVCEISGP